MKNWESKKINEWKIEKLKNRLERLTWAIESMSGLKRFENQLSEIETRRSSVKNQIQELEAERKKIFINTL